MLDTNRRPEGSPARVNASHFCSVSSQPIPTRVVLLAGPSGSGKSVLAARTGLPVLRLDDFYKEHDDPTLPRVPGSTDIDWDSAGSWDADAAVAAIAELCRCGRTDVPVYDIATSSRTDHEAFHIEPPLFVAEGIFAADIVERCQDLGLLADALCLRAAARPPRSGACGCGDCARAASRCRSCCGGAGGDAGRTPHRGPPDGPGRTPAARRRRWAGSPPRRPGGAVGRAWGRRSRSRGFSRRRGRRSRRCAGPARNGRAPRKAGPYRTPRPVRPRCVPPVTRASPEATGRSPVVPPNPLGPRFLLLRISPVAPASPEAVAVLPRSLRPPARRRTPARHVRS